MKKKSVPKGHILYGSIYKAFLKWQKSCQGLVNDTGGRRSGYKVRPQKDSTREISVMIKEFCVLIMVVVTWVSVCDKLAIDLHYRCGPVSIGFLGSSVVKNLPASAGVAGSIPGLGRSPGAGNGNAPHYSCLRNPMDRGAWQATVHGFAKE